MVQPPFFMFKSPSVEFFGKPTWGASPWASQVRSPLPDWRDFKRLGAQQQQKGDKTTKYLGCSFFFVSYEILPCRRSNPKNNISELRMLQWHWPIDGHNSNDQPLLEGNLSYKLLKGHGELGWGITWCSMSYKFIITTHIPSWNMIELYMIIVYYSYCIPHKLDFGALVFMILMTIHSTRAHVFMWKTDPASDNKEWPNKLGEACKPF